MNKLRIIEKNDKNNKISVEYTIEDKIWEKEIESTELMVDLSVRDTDIYSNISLKTYAVEIVQSDDGSNKYYVYTKSWIYYKGNVEYNDDDYKTYKSKKCAETYAFKLRDKLYKTGFLNHGYCILNVA